MANKINMSKDCEVCEHKGVCKYEKDAILLREVLEKAVRSSKSDHFNVMIFCPTMKEHSVNKNLLNLC